LIGFCCGAHNEFNNLNIYDSGCSETFIRDRNLSRFIAQKHINYDQWRIGEWHGNYGYIDYTICGSVVALDFEQSNM